MEETAYFLHLTVPSDKPVVLVGSMRPGTAMSADGAMNLFNAVALAGAPEARGKGVLLTLNETVFGARDVTKGNTTNPATFEARNAGPMGSVFFGEVNLYEAPIQAHTAESEFTDISLADEPTSEDLIARMALLFGRGLSLHETVDYLVVKALDHYAAEQWASIRGVGVEAVRTNVREAQEQLALS